MEISTQEIIGNIGEATAIKKLTEMGYEICRADGLVTVGHSLMFNNILNEFDCANLYLLSYLCAEYFRCEVESQPCLNASAQFFAVNLQAIELHAPSSVTFNRKDDNRFRYGCANKLSNVAILNKCGNKCKIEICPIKSYLAITHYVSVLPALNRMLSREGLRGLNRNIEDFERMTGAESEVRKCDEYFDADHDIVDFFGPIDSGKKYDKHLRSHPGRIDLFGVKNGQYCFFEVKTNTAKLSPWQVINLNWLKQCGFVSAIIRVNLKYQKSDDLLELYRSLPMEELIEIFKPTFFIEDFKLSEYPRFHDIIPSAKDVEFYNCKSLAFEMDIKALYNRRKNQNA